MTFEQPTLEEGVSSNDICKKLKDAKIPHNYGWYDRTFCYARGNPNYFMSGTVYIEEKMKEQALMLLGISKESPEPLKLFAYYRIPPEWNLRKETILDKGRLVEEIFIIFRDMSAPSGYVDDMDFVPPMSD